MHSLDCSYFWPGWGSCKGPVIHMNKRWSSTIMRRIWSCVLICLSFGHGTAQKVCAREDSSWVLVCILKLSVGAYQLWATPLAHAIWWCSLVWPDWESYGVHAGGMILFNPNATQHLPTAVNAAFLATLYADYLKAADVPVLECGPNWYSPEVLRNFSRSQVHFPKSYPCRAPLEFVVLLGGALVFDDCRESSVVLTLSLGSHVGRLRAWKESLEDELRCGIQRKISFTTPSPSSLHPRWWQELQLRTRVAVEGPQFSQSTCPSRRLGWRSRHSGSLHWFAQELHSEWAHYCQQRGPRGGSCCTVHDADRNPRAHRPPLYLLCDPCVCPFSSTSSRALGTLIFLIPVIRTQHDTWFDLYKYKRYS